MEKEITIIYLWFIENSVFGLGESTVLDKIVNVNCNRKSASKHWIKLWMSVVFNPLSLFLLLKRCLFFKYQGMNE